MVYIKFILGQLKLFGMIILAFFMFPFITYPRRKEIWNMKDLPLKKWYWKYSDTSEGWGTEEQNYLNSTYGVYELVKKRDENGDWQADYERFGTFSKIRKWFIAYHWLVFRNGCWNYIITNKPKQGEWENVVCKTNTGDGGCTTWRTKVNFGKQSVTWEVDGEEQFRYSFTKKAKWYNIQRFLAFFFNLFTLKIVWHKYYNFMWGMSNDRYLVKTRTFNVEDN